VSDPGWVIPALLNAFLERAQGKADGAPGLPALRFPEVPGGPLGPAISPKLGVRHWQQLIEEIPRLPMRTVLDFGCGAGGGRTRIQRLGFDWHGLDIPNSQEALARKDDRGVTLYDGLKVPLEDASFYVVLSTQTFEHVADPHLTFAEIARVLEPGGYLVGSTSHLEPFHSDSTFTYTAAVFADLVDQYGMTPIEISAGMDGLTLMTRRLVRQLGAADQAAQLNPFFGETSPLNALIEQMGTAQGVPVKQINALKLQLVGQFHFLARKR